MIWKETLRTAQSKQATWPNHSWARDAVNTLEARTEELRQSNNEQAFSNNQRH